MKVTVVGGGIVGMMASFILARRGEQVTLVEASQHLGGLLKGPNFGSCNFDHGSHLIATTGVPEMDDFLIAGFTPEKFNLFTGHDSDRSGSFSNAGWNEDSGFVDVRAIGIAEDIIRWRCSDTRVPAVRSAYEQLQSLYGPKATTFFQKILEDVFGKYTNELSANAVKLMALHRAIFMSTEDIDNCQDISKISLVLAHPERAKFNQRIPPETCSLYPKKRGLCNVIDEYELKLKQVGVRILKSTTLERDGNDLFSRNNMGEWNVVSPNVLWTAGVPSAAKLFLNKSFDPAPCKKICWIAHVELSKKLRSLTNYYYWVRHAKLNTYRLTNYCAMTGNEFDMAYTLEITASQTMSERDMKNVVKSELLAMGLIEDFVDVTFLRLSRLNYSFLNASTDFESWCGKIVQELKKDVSIFGPWSSKGMFFTGDCLRDLYVRLQT